MSYIEGKEIRERKKTTAIKKKKEKKRLHEETLV